MKTVGFKYLLITLLIAFITVFTSCNKYAYNTIYNQLDFILYLEVKKYFDPDDRQKEFARQRLSSLLEWNRHAVLPRFRELLVYVRASTQKKLTAENINYFYAAFQKQIEMIAEKAAPDMAEFVLTLDHRQLENFKLEALKHRNEEIEEEKSEGGNRVDRRTRSAVKFMSAIYGSFSDEQTEQIRRFIEKSELPEYEWRDYRSIMQDAFINHAYRKTAKDEMALFLKNWLTGNSSSTPAPFRERFEARRKFNISLYLYIDNSIVNETQRIHAAETLDNWISTINSLTDRN